MKIQKKETETLSEDVFVSTNSITDLMDEELKKTIRTIMFILENAWPLTKINEPRLKTVRKDAGYITCRKAILDGFNDYNRFLVNRILNPIFEQNNASIDELTIQIEELRGKKK
jgi:hypothetical protein